MTPVIHCPQHVCSPQLRSTFHPAYSQGRTIHLESQAFTKAREVTVTEVNHYFMANLRSTLEPGIRDPEQLQFCPGPCMGAEGWAVALKCRSEPSQTPAPPPACSHMLLTCLGRGLIFHGSASAAGHLLSTLPQRPGRWSAPRATSPVSPRIAPSRGASLLLSGAREDSACSLLPPAKPSGCEWRGGGR